MANKSTHIIDVKTTGAGKSERQIKGVNKSLGGLAKKAGLAAAAYFGARALIAGIRGSIDAFGRQQDAEKSLEVALGRTSKALLSQASALQQLTIFGDEAIIEAQAMIATFVDDEEAIKLATKATLDLAAAKGMDLKAAADLVSKTLGSSTNAMSRYGIEVTGAVGSTERLTSLTENISDVFGGQASEQANTMAGSMAQMSNAVGDAAESLGEALSPIVISTAKVVKNLAEGLQYIIEQTFNLGQVTTDSGIDEQLYKIQVSMQQLGKEGIDGLTDEMKKVEAELKSQQLELDGYTKKVENVNKPIQDLAENNEALSGQILGFTTGLKETNKMLELNGVQYGIVTDSGMEFTNVLGETKIVLSELNQEQEASTLLTIEDNSATITAIEGQMEFVKAKKAIIQKIIDEINAKKTLETTNKKLTISQIQATGKMLSGVAQLAEASKASALVVARLQQASILASTAAGMMAAISPPTGKPDVEGWLNFAAVLTAGIAQGKIVEQGLSNMKAAQYGMNEIVDSPTLIMAGEAGAEQVNITPLEGENRAGGGAGANITFNNPIMTKDFVEGELAEAIRTASRQGVEFGI